MKSQDINRAMDILQEAHEDGGAELDFVIRFKAPDGTTYRLGKFEVDDDHEIVTVDLLPNEST